MTSERRIERDLSGMVVMVSAMSSSMRLQATGCTFVVFRDAGASPAQRKGCAGANAPTRRVVRLESSILQKDHYAFVGRITAPACPLVVCAVRLLWIVLSILGGACIGGVIAYLAAWIVIPRRLETLPGAAPLQTA